MSQDRIRLLSSILYSHFGSATGEVGTLLLQRGALPFAQLLRLSALPTQLVYSCLFVLSAHSLLYHSETDLPGGKTQELYEINERAVEERARIARFANMANEGSKAKDFQDLDVPPAQEVEDVLLKEEREGPGHELREVLKGLWRDGMKRAEMMAEEGAGMMLARRVEKDEEKARERARKVVQRALNDGYISVVTPASQVSPSSIEIRWEEDLKLTLKNVPSAKDTKDIRTKIAAQWAEHREDERRKSRGLPSLRDEESQPKTKKRKKNEYMDDDGEEDFRPKLRPLPIMREFAETRFGPLVAYVFGVILDIVESKVISLEDPESVRISLREITSHISADDNAPELRETFPEPSDKFPHLEEFLPERHDNSAIVYEICALLSDSGDNAHSLIDPRRGQQKNFLNAYGTSTPGGAKWSVAFEELGARIKRALVEAIIEEKLDSIAVRCWRILDSKGKLDEKHVGPFSSSFNNSSRFSSLSVNLLQLARVAFLSVKDAREAIARLSSSFLIEPQEVPRTADRAPSRTFFLWYVDYDKVVQSLLDHEYKALANILAQKEHQLGLKKGLVEKRERLDVRQNSDLLTKSDKIMIKNLDSILEALTVAEMRIDRDVFVLRELDPAA